MRQTRDDLLYEVARMYYFQNVTMDAIAHRFTVSRSTVSRILSEAREAGVVQIRLERGDESSSALEQSLHEQFGVNAHVVPDSAMTSVQRSVQLASVAAQLLSGWMAPGLVLGVTEGATVQLVIDNLPSRPCAGSIVVQLHGTIGPSQSAAGEGGRGVLSGAARAFGAEEHPYPVPAFFDYAATRDAMWHERSVQRIRALQSHADIALFGVGSFRGPLVSSTYASGYLSDEDLDDLRRQRVAGDVGTVMLRVDGSFTGIALNERCTGITPDEAANIPRRLLVADGRSEVLPTLAALRAGVATDLVIDEAAAHSIVANSAREAPRSGA